MDFAQPVSFKNADIGRCAHQEPPEEEAGAVTTETVIQPEPVPTPLAPAPTPFLTHVSVSVPLLSHFTLCLWSLSEGRLLRPSTARTSGRVTCL